MRIADLLADSAVLLDPPLTSKESIFAALDAALRPSSGDVPAGEIAAALEARERSGTTFLGEGVAVPHAFVPGLDGARVALCRPAEPLPYTPEGRCASLVVALIAPPGDMGRHVRVLAGIARLFLVPNMRERLAAATSPRQIIELIACADAGEDAS